MPSTDLMELASRVEAGEGPDREADLGILNAVSPKQWRWAEFGGLPGLSDQRKLAVELEPEWLVRVRARGEDVTPGFWEPDICRVPAYTASLDAAMTLVPEGLCPGVSANVHHGDWYAWMGALVDGQPDDIANAAAFTAPLALTAAALRARAHQGAAHVDQ